MARVIKFCNMQAYQTGTAGVFSEIFEVTDITRLDGELRVSALTGTTPSYTAVLQTTSDPTFDDGAWQPLTTPGAWTGTTTGTFTGAISGMGRFLRAKLTIGGASGMVTACLNAVGREP